MLSKIINKPIVLSTETALPGRDIPLPIENRHFVNQHPIAPPFPDHMQMALFGMGCFWGAESIFWPLSGVYSTAVGYAGGYTPNPTYEEVCSGRTGHNEVVLIIYDPDAISYRRLLAVFWKSHDPTQYMRQGNDIGMQYRSGIYIFNKEQEQLAKETALSYQSALDKAGFSSIKTEIMDAPGFYYAETYHQQYLAKNPEGYCGLVGTGVE